MIKIKKDKIDEINTKIESKHIVSQKLATEFYYKAQCCVDQKHC